ncbi:MAG TPA: hypothetical protein EYQ75_16895 [Planctomycetaceae bacterium]|nr:hypothetical protein [Planctomycetaceae bacterium]
MPNPYDAPHDLISDDAAQVSNAPPKRFRLRSIPVVFSYLSATAISLVAALVLIVEISVVNSNSFTLADSVFWLATSIFWFVTFLMSAILNCVAAQMWLRMRWRFAIGVHVASYVVFMLAVGAVDPVWFVHDFYFELTP